MRLLILISVCILATSFAGAEAKTSKKSTLINRKVASECGPREATEKTFKKLHEGSQKLKSKRSDLRAGSSCISSSCQTAYFYESGFGFPVAGVFFYRTEAGCPDVKPTDLEVVQDNISEPLKTEAEFNNPPPEVD
ncbi:MAG: hypothetical protein ACOYL6_14915 [Bacteriovoracaceae bacterium]